MYKANNGRKGCSSVPIACVSDKRAIPATFVISLDGTFLPLQLIYGGKTDRSIPKIKFPSSFSLSANKSHYSNTNESVKLINEILVPYVVAQRISLNLPHFSPAIIILDVFRGQQTAEITTILAENNILSVDVPNNVTHMFQPLDSSVIGWVRTYGTYMGNKFTSWFSDQIRQALDNGRELEDIDIKVPLSTVKLLHASWLIDMYNEMTSATGRDVIVSGWKGAGI